RRGLFRSALFHALHRPVKPGSGCDETVFRIHLTHGGNHPSHALIRPCPSRPAFATGWAPKTPELGRNHTAKPGADIDTRAEPVMPQPRLWEEVWRPLPYDFSSLL